MINITEFGIFVELPYDLDGMVHLSDISFDDAGEESIKKYKINDKIKFKILEIDVEKERVSLGIKQLKKDKSRSEKYKNKTVTGVIESIEKDKILVVFDENQKGFIKKSNLAKLRSEQNTNRFAVKEKIDAKVIKKVQKNQLYELSVKDLEIEEEKEALKEYGSSSSGASIGDILGAALEKDKKKSGKEENEK